MTAEISVMNRMGVALAADSAVTVGSSARKIYTSAEKLFQLSECAPVGVMVYGNASYVSLPWETIIKAYRRSLGKTVRPTVAAYCKEFVQFLRDHPELFPKKARQRSAGMLLGSMFEEVAARWNSFRETLEDEKLAVGECLEADDITATLKSAIESVSEEVMDHDPIEGLTDPIRAEIKDEVSAVIAEAIAGAFPHDGLPDGTEAKLFDLSMEYMTRQILRDFTSGVVIAGFGEEEFTPAVATFEVEECAGGLPRVAKIKATCIADLQTGAHLMPYAQKDSVYQFLFGLDSQLESFLNESVTQLTNGLIDVVLDKVGEVNVGLANGLRSPVKKEVADKLKELFDSWDEQQSLFFRPILDVISVLPKDELAAMAEAFVNLTKFRRRVTPVAETVSGPIDVAVITKGDGFVWIRRKHYFSPEINPRIMARFQRPGEGP